MSSHTKIVVLRSKELLYTLILLLIGIAILLVLLSLFMPSQEETVPTASQSIYMPGVYTTPLQLGNSCLELVVTVDADHINAVSVRNLDETIATMYPLMEPTLAELRTKILEAQSLEVTYSTENKYTSLLILNAVSQALEKAAVTEDAAVSPSLEMQ